MTLEDFHGRAKSKIQVVGPEQERKLSEFLVFMEGDIVDGRIFALVLLDSIRVKRGSLDYVDMWRNERGIGRIEIGLCGRVGSIDCRIFYMALPPEVFTPVSEGIKRYVYPQKGIARLIVTNLTNLH